MVRSWDKGIAYETAKRFIYGLGNKKDERYKEKKPDSKVAYCYANILLLQLRNGLRIGEAIEAYKYFLREKKLEFEIKAEKKKSEVMRLVVIPDELLQRQNDKCEWILDIDTQKLKLRIVNYVRKYTGLNTHTLRYAFITKLLKEGTNPAIVAKITKHSKLDYIITYAQENEAKDILRGMG